MEYYKEAWRKYDVFTGRASRSEFWYFVLFNFIAGIIVGIIAKIIGDHRNSLGMLYSLIALVPSIAVGIRRLHDINKSGWWLLLCLIPLIGQIWLIILYATPGDVGENKYGPSSKGIEVK